MKSFIVEIGELGGTTMPWGMSTNFVIG